VTVTIRPHQPRDEPGSDIDLSVDLAGRTLASPLLLASGCAAAGRELAAFNDLRRIGGVVTKSIQSEPRSGRPTPRMAETASGMLNSIGLQGPGLDAFIEHDLAWLRDHEVTTFVSIAGSSVEEYAKLAGRLRGHPVAGIEINISCPNVADRGQVFACHADSAAAVVAAVRRTAPSGVAVFAKLSPDVTDIVEIAGACLDAGANGLTLINTTLGVAIDPVTMRPTLAATTGGLSGPAIKPIAMRCVWQVHAAFPAVPILAVGGVRTGLDVLEFVLAGATVVQLGTVLFHDPGAPTRITRELRAAMHERQVGDLADLRGLAHRSPAVVVPQEPDPPGDASVTTATGAEDVAEAAPAAAVTTPSIVEEMP
jgi:dihydroorotate dehydrogenase (NAD+) catalytic subunit